MGVTNWERCTGKKLVLTHWRLTKMAFCRDTFKCIFVNENVWIFYSNFTEFCSLKHTNTGTVDHYHLRWVSQMEEDVQEKAPFNTLSADQNGWHFRWDFQMRFCEWKCLNIFFKFHWILFHETHSHGHHRSLLPEMGVTNPEKCMGKNQS